MVVSKSLQERVTEKVHECISTAERHFNRPFGNPEISYNLRGLTAGVAYSRKWLIKINPVFLNENIDDMLNNTVPHEVAHLITNMVYGREAKSHGWQWKTVMMMLGVEPTRCHSYDSTNAQVRVKNKFHYKCNCQKHIFGPVRHRKAQTRTRVKGRSGYKCRRCKASLVFDEALGQVTYQQVRAGMKKPVKKKTIRKPKKGSKMELALHIYKENQNLGRKAIIGLFITALSMSRAGATTYYYNCQKRAA